MKTEKLTYRFIILTLVALNVFILYKYNHDKNAYPANDDVNTENNLYDTTLFHEIYDVAIESNGIKIDKNLTFTTCSDKILTLNELINSSPILVFDFKHISCKTCFEDEMVRIINVSNEIGHDNVIFVSEFKNRREQYVLEKKYGIKIFNIGEKQFGLPIENEYYPFIFIIDSNFIAKDVYVPTSEFFSLGNIYFSIIYEKYFRN